MGNVQSKMAHDFWLYCTTLGELRSVTNTNSLNTILSLDNTKVMLSCVPY